MFTTETQTLILILDGIVYGFFIAYIISGVIIVISKPLGGARFTKSSLGRSINLMWLVSKWPALVYLILDPFAHWACGMRMDGWYWLFELINIYNWYWYRNIGDDDDFWKKKLKKLSEKIAQIGSKLVTLPEPA
jgi:hypothetical protein